MVGIVCVFTPCECVLVKFLTGYGFSPPSCSHKQSLREIPANQVVVRLRVCLQRGIRREVYLGVVPTRVRGHGAGIDHKLQRIHPPDGILAAREVGGDVVVDGGVGYVEPGGSVAEERGGVLLGLAAVAEEAEAEGARGADRAARRHQCAGHGRPCAAVVERQQAGAARSLAPPACRR